MKKKINQLNFWMPTMSYSLRQYLAISSSDSRICWCSGNALRVKNKKEKRKKSYRHREKESEDCCNG